MEFPTPRETAYLGKTGVLHDGYARLVHGAAEWCVATRPLHEHYVPVPRDGAKDREFYQCMVASAYIRD